MLSVKKDFWKKLNIETDIQKYFFLRWEELVNEKTFDSWQVRFSNHETLLVEMFEVALTIENLHKHHPNIKVLLDEFVDFLKKDLIIKHYFPFVKNSCKKLEIFYNTEIKNKNSDNYSTKNFKKEITFILTNLSKYPEFLKHEILQLLTESPPSKDKNKLEILINLLISLFSSKGYSLLHLKEIFENEFQSTDKSFIERIEYILDTLLQFKKIEYKCYFNVVWPQKKWEEDISFTDVKLIKSIKLPDNIKQNISSEEGFIAEIKVNALDKYSARHIAEEKLEKLFSINKLYRLDKHAKLRNDIAYVCLNNNCERIDKDNSRFGYLSGSNKSTNLFITKTYNCFQALNHTDASQLTSSLQYHNIALSTNFDEAKFINLWIALESVFHNEEKNKSIIDTIAINLSKISSVNILRDTLKHFLIDTHIIWREANKENIISKLSNKTNKNYFNSLDLIQVFRDGELYKCYEELQADNPLYIRRLYKVKENFLTKENIKNRLEQHTLNIEWHIKRIYRYRNKIIHQGEITDSRIKLLIQHLHSYYLLLIHGIINVLNHNQGISLDDVFHYYRNLYDYFLQLLKEGGKDTIKDTGLMSCILEPHLILEYKVNKNE